MRSYFLSTKLIRGFFGHDLPLVVSTIRVFTHRGNVKIMDSRHTKNNLRKHLHENLNYGYYSISTPSTLLIITIYYRKKKLIKFVKN